MFQSMKRTLQPIAAVLLIAAAAPAALALNVDQNRVMPVRVNLTQQTNYYRFTVNYNDANISTAQLFGALPKNAYINGISCHVTTAFNAATTNVFTVGTSTTATEIIDASTSTKSIDETSATVQGVTHQSSLGINPTSTADTSLYAKYTQSGTAATAGSVTCVIAYIPNNDL